MPTYFTLSLGFRGYLELLTIAHSFSFTKMLKLQMLVKITDLLYQIFYYASVVVKPRKMKKAMVFAFKKLTNQ